MTTVADRSVQVAPPYESRPFSSLVLQLATVADDIPAWGLDPAFRDRKLREFWPTEPVLASGIYSIVARNASFSWTLDGPPRTVSATLDILHNANMGDGWLTFAQQWLTDWLTTDNGAFIEVIRDGDGPTAAVIGIAHLDSGKCVRTGQLDFPIIYYDRFGKRHRMAAHQVVCSSDFPSPVETMNGVGLCAVSRVLRAAQLLRDIGIYLREKVAGRNPAAVHLISGIKASEISDAIAQHQDYQRQKGVMRFDLPVVLATLDPTANISHERIDMASLPDGFDLDTTMRWYINQLALGFGADYQDFAPLPGRSLGSSTQSMVLHEKSRGKGPALFMKTMTHLFNFHGVIPRNVAFRFDEQDMAADLEVAELRLQQAQTDEIYLTQGVLNATVIQQRMLDAGQITQEEFDALQAASLTPGASAPKPDVVAEEDENLDAKAGGDKAARPFADAERRRFERQMAASMRQALDTVAAHVRRKLGRKSLFTKAMPADLPDDTAFWADMRELMVNAMTPFPALIGNGAARYNRGLGLSLDMDLVNQSVLDFSKTYTDDWWNEIEDTTRRAMRRAITDWQEGKLGSAGLPDLERALAPLFGRTRATLIASTEVTRLFDLGNQAAHVAAGVKQEQWQTVHDRHVDPDCVALDGEMFGVREGPRPPAHPRCRCVRLPVANDINLRFA